MSIRPALSILTVAVALLAGGGLALPARAEPVGDTVAIVGGHVLTVAGEGGGEIPNGTVLVRDGKIIAVGPAKEVAVPAGARVIDAAGRYVMPGIIDTHSHMGVYPWAIARGSSDGNEATDPLTPFVRAEDSIQLEDPAFERARAGGCTTVHVIPGSANLMGGEGVVLKLRPVNTLAEMKVDTAPRTLKMAFGENPKRVYGEKGRLPSTRMGNVAMLREAFRGAREYAARWAQYRQAEEDASMSRGQGVIPVTALARPAYDPTLALLGDVLRGEVRLHIHCYRKDDMLAIFRLQDEFGLKVAAIHHALESYKVAPELARRKIGVCTWADWWGFKMEAWDAIPQCAGLLARAGVVVSIHSDSSDGVQRLHHEAAKAVRWGLEPAAALAAVTLWPARLLGIDDRTGSLEVGKDADIAVFTRHPLDMYALCEWTLIDGAVVYRRESVPKIAEGGLPMPAIEAGPPLPSAAPAGGLVTGERPIAIVGGTVVPVSRPAIPDGVVIVEKGRITAVGTRAATPVPPGADVVDAAGRFVLPGLIDCGTKLGLVEVESDPATQDDDEQSSVKVPHVRVADGLNPRSEPIRVARIAGVTTALVVPEEANLVAGQSAVIDLAGETAAEMVALETFALHVNLGAGPISRGRDRRAFTSRMGLVAELRALFVKAQEYRKKLDRHAAEVARWEERRKKAEEKKAKKKAEAPGAKDAKPAAGAKGEEKGAENESASGDDRGRDRDRWDDDDDAGLPPTPPSRDLELEALLPALERKIPVVFRAHRDEDVRRALAIADEFGLRPIIDHGTEAYRLAGELAARRVPVLYGPVNTQPDGFETVGAIYEAAALLHAANVPLALETASAHNVRLLPYMAGLAAAHGLPRDAALRAVTLGAAEVLGIDRDRGSLDVGKVANVAIFTGDPLQPLSRVDRLFVRGREVALESRQMELYRKFAPLAIGAGGGSRATEK